MSNTAVHPETLPRNSVADMMRARNERLMAKNLKLETELRQIRKLCAAEYANDPHNSTLMCVSRTMLALRTTDEQ